MWKFGRRDQAKSYARLADLLYTRVIVNAKAPNMMDICGKETTTAFQHKWRTMIASIAFAQLAMAGENHPKSRPLIRDFGEIMTESSSEDCSFTLEILDTAWSDVQRLLTGANELRWAQEWLKSVGYEVEYAFEPSFRFSSTVTDHIKAIRNIMDAAIRECEKY